MAEAGFEPLFERKRMQGQSCFTLAKVDEPLVAELEEGLRVRS